MPKFRPGEIVIGEGGTGATVLVTQPYYGKCPPGRFSGVNLINMTTYENYKEESFVRAPDDKAITITQIERLPRWRKGDVFEAPDGRRSFAIMDDMPDHTAPILSGLGALGAGNWKPVGTNIYGDKVPA